MDKKINYDMKLFSAIAILMVVVGHVSSYGFEGPFGLFPPYSYQVAAFVFVSGYFYNDKNENDVLAYIFRKAKRLLLPMFLIYAVYGAIWTLCRHFLGFSFGSDLSLTSLFIDPFTDGHQFYINMPMWFIAPLFAAEFVNILFRKTLSLTNIHGHIHEVIIGILYMTLGAIAIHVGGEEGLSSGPLLFVCRTMLFLSFFAIGRMYACLIEKHDNLPNIPYLVIVMMLQLIVAICSGGSITYTPSWCRFPHGVLLSFAATILSIAFVLRCSIILGKYIGNNPFILSLANNTYSIMCHHYFGFFMVTFAISILSGYFPIFSDFDHTAFHTEGLYMLVIPELRQIGVLYTVIGIAYSLFVHSIWTNLKNLTKIEQKTTNFSL